MGKVLWTLTSKGQTSGSISTNLNRLLKGQGQDIHFTPLYDIPNLVMRNVVDVEQILAKHNTFKES